ncbi:MAG: L,D-transpeptidase family protein [Kiritimatiellia bacterium]
MLTVAVLLGALAFAESKTLAVQICLDRAGFSCNALDGQWGRKSARAAARFAGPAAGADAPERLYDRLFAGEERLFRVETVTQGDLDALVRIPPQPADKARLPRMGYESIKEMFAERGHLSQRALERLNPGVDWNRIGPGQQLVIPDFPSVDEELRAGDRGRPHGPKRPMAALVRVSLTDFEVTAYDAEGRCLALFPCSIAKDKAKLPPHGELKITTYVARPNYTYAPDAAPPGRRVAKHIFPAGPNCPVGVVWLGLNLPGYGIHGTPSPETVGRAESHGCIRLANWNAARLYAMCRPGTRVIIEGER